MMVQYIYNGPSDEGEKKFDRFVKLGPVVNMSRTIRAFPSSVCDLDSIPLLLEYLELNQLVVSTLL